jgi:hypothetical protein
MEYPQDAGLDEVPEIFLPAVNSIWVRHQPGLD